MNKPVTPEELDGFVRAAIHAPNRVADVMVLRVADTLRDEWRMVEVLETRIQALYEARESAKGELAGVRAEHLAFLDDPDALEKAHTEAVRRQDARRVADTKKAVPAPPVAVSGAFRA